MIPYQRNEDKILKDVQDYIDSTYSAHYAGKVSVLDIWDSVGLSKEAFRSNIIKYALRAGKKGDQERQDIIKIIHYSIFLLNEIEKETK